MLKMGVKRVMYMGRMMVVILWRSLSLGDNHNLSLNQFAIQSNNNNGNPEKVSKFSFTNIILST